MTTTRFAPAPTGWLHLGHVANAIYVWGLAAARSARVILRVEDHDRQRSRPEYERQLLDDLDWLGFVPDEFPTDAFRRGPCASRQSDRSVLYQTIARALVARDLVYGCRCSRHDPPAHTRRYPGTCRDRGFAPGPDVAWRIRIDAPPAAVDDLLIGPLTQDPASELGDAQIRDRHGNWTYQFCVAVDDYLQGVDLVVRGRDLLSSSSLQCEIARLVGRPAPPRFAHHALIMRSADHKLSKSDGDTGIRELRAAGATPAGLIGRAAWLVGLNPADEPIDARSVATLMPHTARE